MSWGPWLLSDVEVPALAVAAGLEAGPFVVSRRQLGAMVALGKALAFEDQAVLVHAWGRYLDAEERAGLVDALVRAVPDEAEALADVAIAAASAGPPFPTLMGHIGREAEEWAAAASEAELKHYAIACVRRLGPADKVRFLRAVQKVALAS